MFLPLDKTVGGAFLAQANIIVDQPFLHMPGQSLWEKLLIVLTFPQVN